MTIESIYGRKGHVYLVGAGLGDPELMTVKACRILARSDVVIYDNLVSDEVMQFIPRHAEIIYVGKIFDSKCHLQEEINKEIIKHAKLGKSVCRSKGGDPFVFGRGGEEAIALANANVPYEIVPGITAAIGCCDYAGIPVTHRGVSSGMTIVTGRDQHDSDHINWESLASLGHTLVFYMGLHKAENIANNLIRYGLDQQTPVAIISNGTRHNQCVITCELDELVDIVATCKPPMPAVIVIGDVVKLSYSIEWFSQRDVFDGELKRFYIKKTEAEHV